MLSLVCLASILLNSVNAEHTVRCYNDTNPSGNHVTLEPSPDGVAGRYVMQWCTAAITNVIAWEFHIGFNTSCKPDRCRHYNFIDDKKFQPHSRFEENTNINLNCSHVCLSTLVDLIFEACYHIKNQFHKDVRRIESYDQLIYITNNFTNITTLKATKPYAKVDNHDDYVKVLWVMGPVPANNFTVELYNNTGSEGGAEAEWAARDVTRNCSGAPHTLWCWLWLPPARYSLVFTHCAPWGYGALSTEMASVDFNVTGWAGAGAGAAAGDSAWWGAAGACGALMLCALAALALRRARPTPPQCKDEAASGAAAAAEAEADAAAGGVRVLLLYARDCPALEAAARRLGELLRHVAGDGVYDLYLPATSAQAARAPGEWLRALLEREEVRVVLLQTPAAACLYAAQLRQRGSALELQQPLLSAGAARRRPHCADALLQLALRQLGEAAPHHRHPYRKYYVAEISGLEANVVPLLTPQRRYVLPAAAALLLQDLAEGAPPAPPAPAEAMAQFARAVQQLQQYVRDNPHYLEDELLFL